MDTSEILAPLQTIVRIIASLQETDADAADAALACPVSASATLLSERAASVLAEHGHEILEIDPRRPRDSPSGLPRRSQCAPCQTFSGRSAPP